jgi:hypothetical protein
MYPATIDLLFEAGMLCQRRNSAGIVRTEPGPDAIK